MDSDAALNNDSVEMDLADVRRQESGKCALMIAAAASHNVLKSQAVPQGMGKNTAAPPAVPRSSGCGGYFPDANLVVSLEVGSLLFQGVAHG